MFYGERSGGIRTYLEAKADFARARARSSTTSSSPAGRRRAVADGRHEQPSLRLAASNGYRMPLGSAGLQATLRALAPTSCCSTTRTGRRGWPAAPRTRSAPP